MKIFISYSRADKALVDDVISRLRQVFPSVDIWWDEELNRNGGADWWKGIVQQIMAADVVLYMMSPTANQSEFCQRELTYALDFDKHIVPLILVETEILSRLSHLHCINLVGGVQNQQGMTYLYATLNDLEKSHLPAPGPTPAEKPTIQIHNENSPDGTYVFGDGNTTTINRHTHNTSKAQDTFYVDEQKKNELRQQQDDMFRQVNQPVFKSIKPLIYGIGAIGVLFGLILLVTGSTSSGIGIAAASILLSGVVNRFS